jgi:glutamate 5-kinase
MERLTLEVQPTHWQATFSAKFKVLIRNVNLLRTDALSRKSTVTVCNSLHTLFKSNVTDILPENDSTIKPDSFDTKYSH